MTKDMKVVGQRILFGGEGEAEEKQVKRQFFAQAGVGAGKDNQGELGSLPALIEYGTTAGAMAEGARTACAGCRSFDQKAWHRFLSQATGPASSVEDRQTVQAMKGRIMMAGYGVEDENGEVDIEETVMRHGICRVLSDVIEGFVGRDPMHWPVVSWRESSCPSYVQAGPHRMDVVTPAQPMGFFKALDLENQKIGAQRYDQILFDASGKVR